MPLSLAGSLGTGDTPRGTEGQWHGRAGGTGVQLCPSCQGWEPQAQPLQPQGINPKGSAAVIPKEAPGEGQGFRAEPALSWGWNFALEMMSSALDLEKSERFPCPGCAEHQLGPESSWALSPSPHPTDWELPEAAASDTALMALMMSHIFPSLPGAPDLSPGKGRLPNSRFCAEGHVGLPGKGDRSTLQVPVLSTHRATAVALPPFHLRAVNVAALAAA